jgi:hypothetical protein
MSAPVVEPKVEATDVLKQQTATLRWIEKVTNVPIINGKECFSFFFFTIVA